MRAWIFRRRAGRDDWPCSDGDAIAPWRLPERGAPGVTVSSRDDLAWWMDEELWEVETTGPRLTAGNAVFVPRARLVRRVPLWAPPIWEQFVTFCREDSARREQGSMRPEATRDLLGRLRRIGRHRPALAGYVGALAAASGAAESDVSGQQRRFAEARAIQSAWIARALSL